MKMTPALFDRSVFFFWGILLFSFLGFWVTYWSRISEQSSGWAHIHGAAMYAWVILLITQATLIRKKKRDTHRAVGKLSFIVVPVIVVSSLCVAHASLLARGQSDPGIFILGLGFLGLIPFTLFYCLAMIKRAKPDVHARWMVCTGITLIDPIFARLIGIHFLQVPFESGIINAITYGAMALMTLMLAILDYRDSGRKDVFLPALVIMVLMQGTFLLAWNSSAWRSFAAWYAALPLG